MKKITSLLVCLVLLIGPLSNKARSDTPPSLVFRQTSEYQIQAIPYWYGLSNFLATHNWQLLVISESNWTFGNYEGTNESWSKTIKIKYDPSLSLSTYIYLVLHEIGHSVDYECLTDQDRIEYRRARGLDAESTWDYGGPAENFADLFAYANWKPTWGYRAGFERFLELC